MLQLTETSTSSCQYVVVQEQDVTSRAIQDWRSGNDVRRIAVESLIARVFDVPLSALRTTSRGRAKVALARQTAMYITHVVCGLSMTEVGRIFERDRTTVSHACALIEDRRDEPIFDQLLEMLERIACEEIRRRLGSEGQVIAERPDRWSQAR